MDKTVRAFDGGGTKTAALVADIDGNVRELVFAVGCNPQDAQDWKTFLRVVFVQASNVESTVVGMPEGGLKLMEMAITATQTFQAGEYRHGPISLIDEGSAAVILYHSYTVEADAKLVREA